MLIDRFLPEYDVSERHHTLVRVPADVAYRAVRRLDLARSRSIRAAFAARGLPLLLRRRGAAVRTLTLDDLVRGGFVLLAEEPGTEVVLGVVGRFWTPRGSLRRVEADDFCRFEEPGEAKAVWNFWVESLSDGSTLVVTETRVRCPDEATRRKFLLYWAAIGPFSGLIRRLALRLVRRDAERDPRP